MIRAALRSSTLVLVLAGGALAPAVSAAPSLVPGTRVTLEPPDGFAPAQRFPGFERPELGASIMVTELPVGFDELRIGMTREGLASRDMELIESRQVSIAGAAADLLHVRQQAFGLEFLKWMLVTGNGSGSVMVVGTFPKAEGDSLGAAVRTAVLSTSLRADGEVDLLQGLPFDVSPGDKLKVAGRMGNMLMLTRGGTTRPTPPEDPLYVVGSSLVDVAPGDLRAFAEHRAMQTAQTRNVRILSSRDMGVDGLQAYEIVADADDTRSGKPIRLYQVIAPEGRGYFIFQGLVGPDGAPEYLAEFRRLTSSFRRHAP